MSYLALARKWRPRTFAALLGQEHISKALTNALVQQRLHHAYLFTGTRGVGKTSVARILAKALNCEQGISAQPCLQCDACISIEQGNFIDLIEVDGASKTRIEDIRELLDNVQYASSGGRFKIFLIDEVHMLSQHSFNALLKTLEEPPAHVKFILATTDPQKIPVTILSRCLQFHLKCIPRELINQQLQLILQEEKLDYEMQALDILSQAAHGSMRDALSLLDQAITSCEKKLSAQDVKKLLGYTQQDYAIKLIDALANKDSVSLLNISRQIANEGSNFPYILNELLNYFHTINVYQSIGKQDYLIELSNEIESLAGQFSPEDIQLFYHICLKGTEEINFAPTLEIGFNMIMLRMLTFQPAPSPQIPLLAKQQSSHKSQIPNSTPEKISQAAKENVQESILSAKDWYAIVLKLKLTGLVQNAIINLEFVAKNGAEIILKAAKNQQALFSTTILNRMEESLKDYFKTPIKINLQTCEVVYNTPAQQNNISIQEKLSTAQSVLNSDLTFLQIQKEFTAELIKDSVELVKDAV